MAAPLGEEMDDQEAVASGTAAEVESSEEVRDEQENLATEWEEMTSTSEADRVLNQDEIDSLLGHEEGAKGVVDQSGIQTILGAARSDRLPMLEVVFDRLVRLLSTSLRNFTSDNVEVSLDNISSFKFGDYLDAISMPAMLNIFKAEEWDHSAILTVDSTLVYSMIDVLLGGRRDATPVKSEERSFTLIERNLVERMVHVVLDDLSDCPKYKKRFKDIIKLL